MKTAQRRFMVPIPKVHDLSVLNERVLARCLGRLDALEAGEHLHDIDGDLDVHIALDLPPPMASVNSLVGLVTSVYDRKAWTAMACTVFSGSAPPRCGCRRSSPRRSPDTPCANDRT